MSVACSVDGCNRTGKMRLTYCENHYRKYKRHGTPERLTDDEIRAQRDLDLAA